MKKYKVIIVSILSFVLSYLLLLLFTYLSVGKEGSTGSLEVYTIRSYITSLIFSILMLISTVISCTYVIIHKISNK